MYNIYLGYQPGYINSDELGATYYVDTYYTAQITSVWKVDTSNPLMSLTRNVHTHVPETNIYATGSSYEEALSIVLAMASSSNL